MFNDVEKQYNIWNYQRNIRHLILQFISPDFGKDFVFMKFSIGYYSYDEGDRPFSYMLDEFGESIEEVYFPWVNIETCRSSLTDNGGYIDWNGQERLENDLIEIRKRDIRLNLLINANCYGEKSISEYLMKNICSIINHINDFAGLPDTVTTTSPAVAYIIKSHYKEIEVRASVNMMIGSIQGMKYLSELFDGFYIRRENNRHLDVLRTLKKWADENSKKIYILANSGCMSFCSGQIFHDNLVAHEKEISQVRNMKDFNPYTCWNYYRDPNNWPDLLRNTWIRPEDINNYNDMFTMVKIASRMSLRPVETIKAYVNGSYDGNLLNIMEPGHGSLLYPNYIDNKKFPDNWFIKTSTCDMNCSECGYCDSVFKNVLTSIKGM